MSIVQTYFDAFNAGDTAAMLACLTDDVAHHVNEGAIRVGKVGLEQWLYALSREQGVLYALLAIFIAI